MHKQFARTLACLRRCRPRLRARPPRFAAAGGPATPRCCDSESDDGVRIARLPPPAALPPADIRAGHLSASCRASPSRANRRSSSRRPTSITSSFAPASRRRDIWVPYNEQAEMTTIATTSSACGRTNFLDDLSIEVNDYVVLERRRRQARDSTTWRSASASRSSTTRASKKIDRTKIDEKLKDEGHRAAARLVRRRERRFAASTACSAR